MPASRATEVTVFSSVSSEWYTPREWIDRVERVLGHIDLDPASSEQAQGTIQAKEYFTKEDDGLCRDWHGVVFCNPPYGQVYGHPDGGSVQGVWAKHLERQYVAGNVSRAILLTRSAVGYQWYERLVDQWPVCMVRELIPFTNLEDVRARQSRAHLSSILDHIGATSTGSFAAWVEC